MKKMNYEIEVKSRRNGNFYTYGFESNKKKAIENAEKLEKKNRIVKITHYLTRKIIYQTKGGN